MRVRITVIATGFDKPFQESASGKRAPTGRPQEHAPEPQPEPQAARGYDASDVSPIFSGDRPQRERSYLDDIPSYEPKPQPRQERVYQDRPYEEQPQPRRGFTPDVPSFLRRK